MAEWPAQLPEAVTIVEVGPRDGLQSADANLPTAQKVELIERLVAAGLRHIEATSFVSPRAVPLLADADQVMARVKREPGVRYIALVPNRRGLERAIAAHVDEVTLPISASDGHSRANLRRSTAEVLAQVPELVELAHGHGLRVRGGIATAFGCPYEGVVPVERVLWLTRQLVEAGVDSLTLADTVGMAHPLQVEELVCKVREVLPPGFPLGIHLHDTRGIGLANALAALQAGVTEFDASVGGIGGCPFAPGAPGNISTEGLVYMLEQMGIRTNVDGEAVEEAARWLHGRLKSETDARSQEGYR
ncbi:MAG: hydroxymethylglutaryl-CoA lyase [Caldilineae bacterium]|nr:MAG: hydroxymethylglutaryl-CoA lyase [Caldilineae bacterium]